MIKDISFTNYRVFANKQKLHMAPITVLFGKNNSGKSAVLKLPVLLESALKCTSNEVFSKFHNEVLLCNELRDVVFNKANRAVSIEASSQEGDLLAFSFYVDMTDRQKKTHLETWKLANKNGLVMEYNHNDIGTMVDLNGKSVTFNGIIPQGTKEEWITESLSHFMTTNDYMTHVRILPGRDYRLNESQNKLMGLKGDNAYDFLIRDLVDGNGSLLQKVSDWYEKVFDGWKVNIDQSRYPAYSIELQNQNVKNHIIDTGAGIGQSLPEIIAISKNCDGIWQFILEEPETHLHPAAHAEMAEFIAKEVIANRNKHVMVETHSLNFILRLRTLVASGVLNQDDLALYYVEYNSNNGASVLNNVEVYPDGSVSEWPDNVFNESYKEAVLLHNAQKNRK